MISTLSRYRFIFQIIGGLGFGLGFLMRILHWHGARSLLIGGMILLTIGYLLKFYQEKYRDFFHAKEIVGFIGGLFIFLSAILPMLKIFAGFSLPAGTVLVGVAYMMYEPELESEDEKDSEEE